jgi:glycosyltransferase involved in cell wall biosynthesis
MRVLQILLPVGMGGVESIANMLDHYLNDKGYESYIAIGKSYYKQYLRKFNNNNEDIRYIPISDSNLIRSILDIKRTINNIHPDIIQTHARRECVYTCLCTNQVAHIRTQHMEEAPTIKVSKLEKLLLDNRVTAWVATSEKLKNDYFRKLSYIDQDKIKVIYNGVEDTFKNSGLSQHNTPSFCLISRLTKQKGIDILLSQLAKFPTYLLDQIHIDIWGEGPELNNIQKLIQTNHLSSIVAYKGPTDNPRAVFNNYSALLMPSRYEGLPLTMLESMSYRLPVATHDVGCCSEFIKNKYNGWIVKSDYTWQNFFTDFIQMSNDEYQKIADNARKTFCDKFEKSIMCSNYCDLYRRSIETE